MLQERPGYRLSAPPRVLALGVQRHTLGMSSEGAEAALMAGADVYHLPLLRPARQMATAIREGSSAIRSGCEAVHLFDARLAPAALVLRRRFGVPLSVSVTAPDMTSGSLLAAIARRMLPRFDQGFASDPDVAAALRMPLDDTQPVAHPLPNPHAAAMESMARRLAGTKPGQLVVALPWPASSEKARWYRDAVAPLLLGNPVTLLLGVPDKREFRSLTAKLRRPLAFVPHYGRIDADVLAAAARCADAFVTVATPARRYGAADETLALAASRVPLVACAGPTRLLEHEANALVVERGDGVGLVSTLNKLLALPAVQRHELGIEFAGYTLRRWTAENSAPLYTERFAALVGRPEIPESLRAA